MGSWLQEWLDAQRRAVRIGTYRRYEQSVRLYLQPHLGDKRLVRLEAADVVAMMNDLSETLAPGTIRQIRGVLRAALDSAIEDHKLNRNVVKTKLARGPQAVKSVAYAPDPAMARALVEAAGAYSESLGRAVAFGIFGTGLRAGKHAALRWQDCHLDAGVPHLVVSHSLTRKYGEAGGWVLTDPKTDNSRRKVTLGPGAVASLRVERATQNGSEGYVFRGADGGPRPYDPVHLQTALSRKGLLIRADTGKKLTWDSVCREGHGRLLLQQGWNLKAVAARLGNSVEVLACHYAGIIQADEARIGCSLDALRIA